MRKSEQFCVSLAELAPARSAPQKSWKFIYEWLDSLVFAFITILLMFTFVFRVVGVSGESMVPTLQNGDWLAVRAVNTSIERGDIVVITQPNSLNEPLIKRVIAVGGDTLDIDFITGEVYVNGELLDEPYIAEATRRGFDTTFPLTVPEGYLFVMGDNRNNSLDSRSSTIGFIDERYVLGVAEFRFFPLGNWEIDQNA